MNISRFQWNDLIIYIAIAIKQCFILDWFTADWPCLPLTFVHIYVYIYDEAQLYIYIEHTTTYICNSNTVTRQKRLYAVVVCVWLQFPHKPEMWHKKKTVFCNYVLLLWFVNCIKKFAKTDVVVFFF